MKLENESLKMIQMNSFMKRKLSHRSREKKKTYSNQGENGGGMNWEIGNDIYTLCCVC